MRAGLLGPYEHSLRASAPLNLVDHLGRVLPLEVRRWLASVDAADRSVLDRCQGPVLDLGCGPGRVVHALVARGVPALGIDLAGTAVQLTRRRGGIALQRDLFGPLPGEGRWPTVLLLDGNIGIGGDACRLLARVVHTLGPAGRLLVEVEPDDCDEHLTVRFHQHGRAVGAAFPWARVGLPGLRARAAATGLRPVDTWRCGARTFTELQPR